MFCFLNDFKVAFEENHFSVYALNTDFSKVLDKVPNAELLTVKTRRSECVGECVLHIQLQKNL